MDTNMGVGIYNNLSAYTAINAYLRCIKHRVVCWWFITIAKRGVSSKLPISGSLGFKR